MNLLNPLIELFFPPRCLVCDRPGEIVHTPCRVELPYVQEPFCHRCSQPLGQVHCRSTFCSMSQQNQSLTGIRSVFWYGGGGRQAVIRLKYRGIASLRNWAGYEAAKALQNFELENTFDMIMAVPLHASRLQQRGYNQSDIVARVLAQHIGRPYWNRSLVRQRATQSQVKLDGHQRAGNVRNAFGWQGPLLQGQKILLFDDVCTTGATLNECARTLQQAGAGEIWALTLTRETLPDQLLAYPNSPSKSN